MAEDEYSVPNRIKKAQVRIARQREIVAELNRYGCGESAQKLLDLMEQTLASLLQQERELSPPPDEVQQEFTSTGEAVQPAAAAAESQSQAPVT